MLAGHPAKIPGQVPLRLVTEAGVDWSALLACLRTSGVDLEVLHADDPARNLDDLRRTEALATGDDATARRGAWQCMVQLDAETKALRAVLPLLDRIAPGNGEVQDPRLQDVARIAAAEAAFWRAALGSDGAKGAAAAMGPALPPLPAASSVRIAPAGPPAAAVIAQALAEARLRIGPRRWIVARTAFAHVRTQCRDVAAHATHVAANTRDGKQAGRYRELAAHCEAVVQALDAAFAP